MCHEEPEAAPAECCGVVLGQRHRCYRLFGSVHFDTAALPRAPRHEEPEAAPAECCGVRVGQVHRCYRLFGSIRFIKEEEMA